MIRTKKISSKNSWPRLTSASCFEIQCCGVVKAAAIATAITL
jgi:hypothetical protein